MASESINMYVDEAYLVALINEEAIPISDEKFAHQLHLQEALVSSFSSPKQTKDHVELNNIDSWQDIQVMLSQVSSSKNTKEVGESSQSKPLFCGICMETKQHLEIFKGLPKCNDHLFCTDCISKYVASKIKENIALVECPDPNCKRVIEPESCSSILPKEVFGRWENALCESLFLGYQKFYCPFKDCSALLVDDGGEEVRQSECPYCRRMFCARCRVVWHAGVTCEEFQRLGVDERGSEDIMVMNLAKDKQWKRCSMCKFYVEKAEGCTHMTCRCRYEFCYTCGGKWSTTHSC